MRVLIAHNRYRAAGGEDEVVAAESQLLESQGHTVRRVDVDNKVIRSAFIAGAAACWNFRSGATIKEIVRQFRPDILHVHNFFPLLSPSVHHTASRHGITVVQTLHNYRLVCPAATLYRDGKVCEECVGRRLAWPAVWHACYQNSVPASAASALANAFHRGIGTWDANVDVFIALSDAAKALLVQGGLPSERIIVKPNFVNRPRSETIIKGRHALFVGRFAPEKGLLELLHAWRSILTPLKIIGDGPLRAQVENLLTAHDLAGRVQLIGQVSTDQVSAEIAASRFLIVPSQWSEPFGRVVIEAFANGVPVIATAAGALPELVHHGVTGLVAQLGSEQSLLEQVGRAAVDDALIARLGANALAEFELRFTPRANYKMIYDAYLVAQRNRDERYPRKATASARS